jgi:hypothetical protein
MFGVVGVRLFHTMDTVLPVGFIPGSFRNLSAAALTLFQVLMGDMLAENVYATVLVADWGASIYYVAYILLMGVLMRSLITGAIMSVWQQVVLARREGHSTVARAADIRHVLLNGE